MKNAHLLTIDNELWELSRTKNINCSGLLEEALSRKVGKFKQLFLYGLGFCAKCSHKVNLDDSFMYVVTDDRNDDAVIIATLCHSCAATASELGEPMPSNLNEDMHALLEHGMKAGIIQNSNIGRGLVGIPSFRQLTAAAKRDDA